MNKPLALLASALLALTAIAPNAEAGRRGHSAYSAKRLLALRQQHFAAAPRIAPLQVPQDVINEHSSIVAADEETVAVPTDDDGFTTVDEQWTEAQPADPAPTNDSQANAAAATETPAANEAAAARKPAKPNVVESPAPGPNKKAEAASVPARAVAAAGELGCKGFFPAIGMTLSVPCE